MVMVVSAARVDVLVVACKGGDGGFVHIQSPRKPTIPRNSASCLAKNCKSKKVQTKKVRWIERSELWRRCERRAVAVW